MAWIIEENKLDAQQRDFLDNVDINRKNVWIKKDLQVLENLFYLHIQQKKSVQNRPLQAFY